MGKRSLVLLSIVAMLASGCAKYWYQEGKTFEQCQQDRLDCYNELTRRSDLRGSVNYDFKFMEACMKEKGYRLVPQNKLPLDAKRLGPDLTLHYRMKGIAGDVPEP
jgi:hypothetical protein